MKKTLGIILLVLLLPILLRVNGSKGSTATVETVSCQSTTGTICRAKAVGGNGSSTILWEDRNGLTIRTRVIGNVANGEVYLINVKPPSPGNGDIHEIVSIEILPDITIACTERVQPSWTGIQAGSGGMELEYIIIPNKVKLHRRPEYKYGDPTYLLIEQNTTATHITPDEVVRLGGELSCPSVQRLHTSSW